MATQMTRICHACGHMRSDHRTTCDWTPTNRREPSHNWILLLVWGIVFAIGMGYGYYLLTGGTK